MLIQFFRAIEQRAGNINPQWLIRMMLSSTIMHGMKCLENVVQWVPLNIIPFKRISRLM